MINIICRLPVDAAYRVPPTFNWIISPIPGVELLPFVAMMTRLMKNTGPLAIAAVTKASLLMLLSPAQPMSRLSSLTTSSSHSP